ncbi:SDR family NAD(P)-dependent oxidoreductase [Actinopolymorpha pittospori]|uniref:NAD(P)-dependent dehydrogenase (Short-subunit alcohol dehydrogenase family) n=1 Tax=Actinopolymorpha pittospori TaxID=648752 RepID=A0A927MWU7_9ACTN|nr:SDR family oxidoreductase [Actinopolymorpha pittospori]MBE1604705.1 NAD(P)-dependent dehydrogenase (short-subunit alcohol dehydrogenase family) [Actinopolymorpha pittospori]
MDLQLEGKVAVVTGASKGIGLAIADGFAREGAHVVAGSRSMTPELEGLRETYGVTAVSVDLSTADGPDALVRHAVDQYGGLDVLINGLGAGTPRSSFLDIDDAEWQRIFNLILFSAVRASRAALPHLLDADGSSIINISSVNARLPFPMVVDYSAAKAGLSNLGKSLSEEFAPRGVRVNAICPGPVRTPFWTAPGGFADATAAQAGTTAQEAIDVVVPQTMGISTGRVTEAHEVADLALFLASPAGRQHHRSRVHHRRRASQDVVIPCPSPRTRLPNTGR